MNSPARAFSGGLPPAPHRAGRRAMAAVIAAVLLAVFLHVPVRAIGADDDPLKFVEAKKRELQQKEEALKQEEERLKALRKDVDGRIEKYTKLLAQLEEALKSFDTTKNEKLDHVVKAYEAMPAEDAAARLSAMDAATALRILGKMKSKKAGAVIASMEPGKAASLSEALSRNAKKIPTK